MDREREVPLDQTKGSGLTRREFLGAGIVAGLTLYGLDSLYGGLLSGEVEDLLLDFVEISDFDPFPPSFNYDVGSNHCIVVVHAGYSLTHSVSDWDRYGLYPEYLEDIRSLVVYLEESDELSIFAVERAAYSSGRYEDGLSPPDSTLMIVTKNRAGNIKQYINTPDGKRKQNLDTIFSFLDSAGVEEAWFAGEWGWYHGNACLGALASCFLAAGFDVKGIEGSIYPTVLPQRSNEVLRELYHDRVEIPYLK